MLVSFKNSKLIICIFKYLKLLVWPGFSSQAAYNRKSLPSLRAKHSKFHHKMSMTRINSHNMLFSIFSEKYLSILLSSINIKHFIVSLPKNFLFKLKLILINTHKNSYFSVLIRKVGYKFSTFSHRKEVPIQKEQNFLLIYSNLYAFIHSIIFVIHTIVNVEVGNKFSTVHK